MACMGGGKRKSGGPKALLQGAPKSERAMSSIGEPGSLKRPSTQNKSNPHNRTPPNMPPVRNTKRQKKDTTTLVAPSTHP